MPVAFGIVDAGEAALLEGFAAPPISLTGGSPTLPGLTASGFSFTAGDCGPFRCACDDVSPWPISSLCQVPTFGSRAITSRSGGGCTWRKVGVVTRSVGGASSPCAPVGGARLRCLILASRSLRRSARRQ